MSIMLTLGHRFIQQNQCFIYGRQTALSNQAPNFQTMYQIGPVSIELYLSFSLNQLCARHHTNTMILCIYGCCVSASHGTSGVLWRGNDYSMLLAILPCRVRGAVSNLIALWWWFAHAVLGVPCETTRHGCSLWCLYPHYPFSIHIFCLVMNIKKNITCKNIGQFQFCINLLPLELIWRSASCPRHWNQRWFGDAAFTIPSGKQWDHMSPWPPSWLSAGIDECCRSANESGHQWL